MSKPIAANVAIEVDRLVTDVHRRVFALHRDEIAKRLDPLHLVAPSQLLDLAEFCLARVCSPNTVRSRFRYTPDEIVADAIHDWSLRGLLATDQQLDVDLHLLFDFLLTARAEVCRSLWPGELTVARGGAVRALANASGPLCDQFKRLDVPQPPAARLHHVLTGLRYARMDAHAAAWQDRGLSAGDIVQLSNAQMYEPPASLAVSPLLISRHWLTEQGTITPDGRAARQGIEVATNERCQPLYDFKDSVDWYRSLEQLAT